MFKEITFSIMFLAPPLPTFPRKNKQFSSPTLGLVYPRAMTRSGSIHGISKYFIKCANLETIIFFKINKKPFVEELVMSSPKRLNGISQK